MRQSSNGNRQWLSDQQRTTPSFLQCLGVPPGAPMKSHMTFAEVKKKNKNVANLRIHVERSVNRIRSFRILKNTLPVSLL